LLPTALVAAFFLRSRMLGATSIGLLAIEMANLAVWQGFVIRLAFQQGYWIGWKRAPVHRSEHAARFYAWTIAHAVVPVAYLIAAIFLAFFAVQTLTSHPH
jgi:hypothetical protein